MGLTRDVPELLVIYLFFWRKVAMFVAKIFGYDGYIKVNAFFNRAISIGIISVSVFY